jgi:hypothetical protein
LNGSDRYTLAMSGTGWQRWVSSIHLYR